MKKIKILIGVMSIVVGFFLMNSCSTLEMDDPAAYVILFALEEYNIECIVGEDCNIEDVSVSNDGFWISNLDEEFLNYQVLYDQELNLSGTVTRERIKDGTRQILVPITDEICSIMPETINIDLSPNDTEKTDLIMGISLVKKQD